MLSSYEGLGFPQRAYFYGFAGIKFLDLEFIVTVKSHRAGDT